jgi:hypothetical protein
MITGIARGSRGHGSWADSRSDSNAGCHEAYPARCGAAFDSLPRPAGDLARIMQL